jgi:glycosyltransferase involved in cell wall biosynthesis
MDFTGKRIAVIMGQGIEGCGVTRVATEMQLWARKHGVHLEVFSYDCKFYSRRESHGLDFRIMNPGNISSIRKELDSWDLVIFHSYPHNKFEHADAKLFYHEFLKPLKALKAGFIHEINKTNIDKITYLVPLINEMDVVFHFGTDTWFANQVKRMFPSKSDRMLRFRMWVDMDELYSIRNLYSFADKQKKITYIGRWSTLKNIDRSIEIASELNRRNLGWACEMHGIEASMGSKCQIIDHPEVTYIKINKNTPPHIRVGGVRDEKITLEQAAAAPIRVYPEYERRWGLEFVAQNLFGSAFYSLPKNPDDYGNRMEYTQIEIIGVGTVPLFDEHWGKNNTSVDGTPFYDIPDLAVFSNGTDIPETVDRMLEVSSNGAVYNRMRDVGYEVIRKNFDAEVVLPETLEKIFDLGVDKNKVSDDQELLTGLVDSSFAKAVHELEKDGKLPVLGIKEIQEKQLFYLDGWKQVPKEIIKTKALF